VWLTSPELADRAQQLGAFCRYGTVLPPRLSELAIITTGAFWKASFEWHMHAPIAIQEGISPEIVEAIRKEETPNFENDDERITYEFSRSVWQRRQVSDETYVRARDALGDRGVVDLVGLLGYYGLISMTINVFEIPVPDGSDIPFA
jgi:4-carboxymuconolactone decarboxylase